MYKIAFICCIAIGIPYLLWAKTGVVHCTKDGEKLGELFAGNPINLDEKGKSAIYPSLYLDKLCETTYAVGHEDGHKAVIK